VLPGQKNTKFIVFHKFRQKLANSDVTKEAMNPLLAADSLVDAISFIRRIVL